MTFSSRLAQRSQAPAQPRLADGNTAALLALGRSLGELGERLNTAQGEDRAALEGEMEALLAEIEELIDA